MVRACLIRIGILSLFGLRIVIDSRHMTELLQSVAATDLPGELLIVRSLMASFAQALRKDSGLAACCLVLHSFGLVRNVS